MRFFEWGLVAIPLGLIFLAGSNIIMAFNDYAEAKEATSTVTQATTENEHIGEPAPLQENGEFFTLIVDEETKCQYIWLNRTNEMMPRIDSDGSHYCRPRSSGKE